MAVKRKTNTSLRKSAKKTNKHQTHFMLVLWGLVKMFVHSLTNQICSIWYLNPVYVITRRHKRLYFTDENGNIPVKPRWLERMMDLFRSDEKRQKLLLQWLKKTIPSQTIVNFSSSWNDGIALCALLEALRPGVCPDYPNMQHHNIITNCRLGIKLAQQCFNLPMNMITPEEMAIADRRTERKVFQFICIIKWLSEQSHRKSYVADVLPVSPPLKCYVRGSGLCTGVTGRKARFTFHTTDITKIRDISINIRGPRHDLYCERIVNMLNSNVPQKISRKNKTKDEQDSTAQQIQDRVSPTEHVHGYLDDGFGNIFLRVKDVDKMVNGTSNVNAISFSCQCHGLGNFLFTFIPVFAGIHTISIKTGTRHIGESPYKVKIYQPCDFKQRTTNDTNDKLFILDSLSIGSLDENSNSFNKEVEANPQQENGEKVDFNGNGKSPRKPERLRLKRQFTIRKKRVLRKVVTKNGEEITVLDSSSVPSLSRDASINTDSDLTEDEARGIPSNRLCRDNQSSLGVTKRRLVKGVKKEVERTYFSKSDTDVSNRQEIPNLKGDISLSGKSFTKSYNRDNRTTEIESNLGSPNMYKQKNSNHGNSPSHDRSSQCYQDGYKSIQTDLVDEKGYGCESSLSDSRSHFHGYESISTQANLVSRTVSYESIESPNSKTTLCNHNKVVRQLSIDSPRFFHNVVQSTYTAPSSPGSELTSSTGEEAISPRSNFSLFFQGLDDASLSTFSVKGDDTEITEFRDRMEATVDDNTQVQQSDVVSENPIERLSEKLDRELCYTETGVGYRSDIMAENSNAVSFRSAFSKPGLYSGETFDCSDLTHGDDLSRYDKVTTDTHCDQSCIPGTCSGDGRSGQVRYLQHWIDNQTLPDCDGDHEQTTGIVPFDYDKATPSRLQYTKSSSDSLKGEGIDLPGNEPLVIKQERKTPIPTIGLLGASTSDAVPPDIPKLINTKLHCPEWRDNKPDEILRRKSDTAINNSSQNTTLLVFHTLPSFESAVCLPSNMNIIVPTPHREKCTQVSADEITEATGSTLRMPCLRLTRRRVCIKINSEGDISSGSDSNDFVVDASGHLMQDRLMNTKAQTASVANSHLRITGDDYLFQSLQNLDRRAIRQSTTETVDSGIADENSKPSSVAPSGVAMETRHTFLSGHKLVHRRPYKGIINLDPKLVRSNSTPDSSIDNDGRFFFKSNSPHNGVESKMADNLQDLVVSKRRNFRPLRKGQAVSLSDPELHLSGISRFKSKFPCFMKTTQQIDLCHRFLQNSKKGDGEGVRIQTSDDSDKECLSITKEVDKRKNINVQESMCDTDQVSTSEVETANEETSSYSERKPGHDIDSCKDIFDGISHDHTMDLAVPSQCNDSDVQSNKNSNANRLNPFTSCPEYTVEGSCEKINILTNRVNDFSNNNFQGETANDGISYKRPLQSELSNDGSSDRSKSDTRNLSEKEETADDLFAFLRYENTASHTTYVQNSLSTEKSSDDNYIGFGINRQDRSDLLHNLIEFQNLQNASDNVPTEKTSLQLSENDEKFSETADKYNHINVDNESDQSNTLCLHKDLSEVEVISQSETMYHHMQINEANKSNQSEIMYNHKELNQADEIDQSEISCHQINDGGKVSQSKTTYHPNRKYRASLYHKTRHVSIYPDKRNVITSLPAHYVTSIYFEVEASAFNCISTLYRLSYKHPFSLEHENNNDTAKVDNSCVMSNSRNYEIDLFDMKDEMQFLSCVEDVTDDTNTEPLYVDGLGLTLGQVGIKNNFQIWAASDVTGCPTVSIYGPQPHCVTETCVVYTGDGLYEVIYEVTHPGYYIINVKWRDLEIHESLCKITY